MSKVKGTQDAQHALLVSVADQQETIPTFEACFNAHGMYETMRFVLRLSPRNHQLMETVEAGNFNADNAPSEVIQAYSTYIHETVHWWQHVGSTSGLLLSLSYLAQVHSNMEDLRHVLSTFGAKKPLKGWTDQVLTTEGEAAQPKLARANAAVNNAQDVEYYKAYALDPRNNIHWMIEHNHFESVGHTYSMVYSQLLGMIADTIDPEFTAIPDMRKWDAELLRLNQERHEGFYFRSTVRLPAVGMKAIYEGQACFTQLQFLDGAQATKKSLQEWKDLGILYGIYLEAFDSFLQLSETDCPDQVSDPVVGLFLLVCDLAINPTRGIPFDVECFEDFIADVDVGVRFTQLCLMLKQLPHLKTAIQSYSEQEYIAVSGELSAAAGYDHPMAGLDAITEWLEKAPGLPALMEEHRTFEFEKSNLPLRVFLSHFVAFSKDKYEHPEIFCWPGRYLSGANESPETTRLWLRHLALFSDRGDKDGVYPRKWPGRSDEAVMATFKGFYGTTALYDLTRQWILKPGPFVRDYRWLSENYSQEHADSWGDNTFRQAYGVTLDQFEIVE